MFHANVEAGLWTLKFVAKNTVAYIYRQDSDIGPRGPDLLDMLPTQSRETILSNMRKASCLTLRILMSLYPTEDLVAASEGFAATCT
jgi:hypothetical protein